MIKKNFSVLVLSDLLKRYWSTYLVIGFFAILVPFFQTAGTVLFIHAIRGDNNFTLPYNLHQFLPPIPSNHFMILILAALFLAVSLLIMFFSRKLAVGLMIRYEKECAEEIIRKFAAKDKLLEGKSNSQIIVMLSKDCRQGGRMALDIGSVVSPIGALLVILPIMFYISGITTFALTVLLGLTAIIYGSLSNRSHRIAQNLEESGIEDARMKKDLIAKIQADELSEEELAKISLPHDNFARAYNDRIMMPQIAAVFGGIQVLLSLILISLLIGLGSSNLSLIVLYGTLAIYALTQLRAISKTFTNFHIFLAYFQRAFVIIKGINPEDYGLKLFDSIAAANITEEDAEEAEVGLF